MISIRLPKELEERLNLLSAKENVTKSEIVKEALAEYFAKKEKLASPFDLGKDLFGKYGSGTGTLSTEYKKKVREKIHAKMCH
jgi:hypothetical protein